MRLIWPARTEAELDESIHEFQDAVYSGDWEVAFARAHQAYDSRCVSHEHRRARRTSRMEAVNRRETGAIDNENPFFGALR